MKHVLIRYAAFALAVFCMSACSQDEEMQPTDPKHTPMTFSVIHPGQKSRVTDTDFENGDKIGLFVGETDKPLEIGGNLVNNEALTCNGGSWSASKTLYWDAGTYNAYAYYPYISPVRSIENLPFSVKTDQSGVDEATGMDGYEGSDFLYAQTNGVSASNSPVSLKFKHIMSKLTIRLVKGEDFEGDMPQTAEVYVHNTVPEATIDLSAGVATREVRGKSKTITAKQVAGTIYTAIIVPQRISNRMPLIEVVMKGVSYLFESTFQFKPGTEHLVNLVISNNPDQIKIEIGGEIQDWQ